MKVILLIASFFAVLAHCAQSNSSGVLNFDLFPIKKVPLDCFNFAGRWKGTCTNASGAQTDAEFSLDQSGCEITNMGVFFSTSSIPVAIDGVTNFTFSSNWYTVTVTESASWNLDKTQLRADFNVQSRQYGKLTTVSSGTRNLQSLNINHIILRDEIKIVEVSENAQKIEERKTDCSLEKISG